MAKWFVGWQCDGCKGYLSQAWKPWNCPGCGKEICDSCGWMMGHCKACSAGKSERQLAIAANATGNFDFDVPLALPRFIPCQKCNGTGVLNADATGHEHCEECGTTGRIKA